ncbi:UNKNOWN [Stylonychia lemnae]|uniref:Uncharacterized protein n=1 Tax=Stylonychia lemnae TaxID=5949 RepID=A0A078AR83_STYLE|nr:UNKNOWN [Stylonychia lemnae]|eukprot:CDW84935.1 UNKNOWN [Stylonychia lemnae]
MVDAWTQTSDKGSDNEEGQKLRRVGSQANQKAKASALLSTTGQQNLTLLNQQSNNNTAEINPAPTSSTNSNQINSQNSDPYLNLNQSQKVSMHDSGSSPQPQIRIRKEPFKQPSLPTSLTKFEEKLYNGGKVNANLNNSMINNTTAVLELQKNNQGSEESQQSSNNSSRMSKTPQDKFGKSYSNSTSGGHTYQNLNFMSGGSFPQNLSMKMSKSPYNVADSNNEIQIRQFQSASYKVNDSANHNRHYSSENINQLAMGGVTNSSNALSSRGNKDSQLSQSNNNANNNNMYNNNNNNNSTTVTSPKNLQNNTNTSINSKIRNKSQKVTGLANNTNILYNNMNSLNQDQPSLSIQQQQLQQQQLSNLQQQQRFRSSILTKDMQDVSRSSAAGSIGGGNQNIMSVMKTSGFSNQRQSIIQSSLDKTQLRQNQNSNKKRLPEINEASRINQKTTLEMSQAQNAGSHSYTNNTNHQQHYHSHIIQQQQQVVISNGKHSSSHKYQNPTNNSHQQLIRNQNIFQIQQSLIKNYGGNNTDGWGNGGTQIVNQNAMITHTLAKSMDRNTASFQQRSNYQSNNYVSGGFTSGNSQSLSSNVNNNNNNSANIVLNSHGEYQHRALQQQIQLQNVKL